MRAREFVVKEQRTDEVLPVIAAGAGALARGAGSMIAKGAQAAGNAVKQGATNLAVAGANKLAGTQLGQAAIGAVANATGQQNSSGQAVGSSSAPAGPSTGSQQAAGGDQAQQKQQAQQQAQQQKQLTTNIDKISAQLIAMKQDLMKQQQQPPQ